MNRTRNVIASLTLAMLLTGIAGDSSLVFGAHVDSLTASTATLDGPEDLDAILKKYVVGDFFQYKALQENADDLKRFKKFMDWQATADVSSMTRNEQIAFYINAYNSCCIKAILDRYPVHSPMDVEGFSV